jgi:hypothetical protein
MAYRTATAAEIIEKCSYELKYDRAVRYRRFISEHICPKAVHGVAHRIYSRSKLRVIDGVPFVRYQGELREVTATVLEGERPVVFDIRIKSPYLGE